MLFETARIHCVCTKAIDGTFNGHQQMLNVTCQSSPHLVLPEGYPSKQGDLLRPQPGPHLLPAPLQLPAMPGAAHIRLSHNVSLLENITTSKAGTNLDTLTTSD